MPRGEVGYYANAFYPEDPSDPRVNRNSVPAPVDAATPNVRWWTDEMADQAKHFGQVGFSRVMMPPLCKTQSGSLPNATGYGVFDPYDLGSKLQMGSIPTRFGEVESLQRSVAIQHANGLDTWADCVLHQFAGGRAGFYQYVGAQTDQYPHGVPLAGRWHKTPSCFRSGGPLQTIPPWNPQDDVPDPPNDFPFGDEASLQRGRLNPEDPPGYMVEQIKIWLDWYLARLGLDGLRIDDAKGLWVPGLYDIVTQGLVKDLPLVCEYFDGNPDTLAWYVWSQMKGRMSCLDFSGHWAMRDVFNDGKGLWRLLPDNTYSHRDPFHSDSFVETPDTDNSPDQQIIWNKRLAYFYMLCMMEGRPWVSHRDYAAGPGNYAINGDKRVIDNMIWCRNNMVGGQPALRHQENDLLIIERLGHQVGVPGCVSVLSLDPINPRGAWVQTSFGAHQPVHDYNGQMPDVRTDANGWAYLAAPSNYFGTGNSHACYGPMPGGKWIESAPPASPMRTTQVFEAELNNELDIVPASNGRRLVQRVWCAQGEDVIVKLDLDVRTPLPSAGKISLVLRNETGDYVDTFASGPDGVSATGRTVPSDGWISMLLDAQGLTDPIAYRLSANYMAPQTLP